MEMAAASISACFEDLDDPRVGEVTYPLINDDGDLRGDLRYR